MCNDDIAGQWCNGKSGCENNSLDCESNWCVDNECADWGSEAAAGVAVGIIILIIIIVCICCCVVGCIVCCVMGVGFCAKKGAEAAAAQ